MNRWCFILELAFASTTPHSPNRLRRMACSATYCTVSPTRTTGDELSAAARVYRRIVGAAGLRSTVCANHFAASLSLARLRDVSPIHHLCECDSQ